MVGLNGRVMYTNAPAVKLLEGTDRALLWDIVSAALVEHRVCPSSWRCHRALSP